MRLFLITDMEGCAGVLNSTDWCFPGGRCYETGRMLLTEEVNAAVRGFLEHGFSSLTRTGLADWTCCGLTSVCAISAALRGPTRWV